MTSDGLRERALLAAIVSSSDDAIISKTLDGIITSWNPAAQRMFGYTAAEMIGRPLAVLVPSDRADEEPTILGKLRRGERIDHFETRRQRKDGTVIDVSVSISPISDAEGKIVGASKIARDITQHKAAEETRSRLSAIVDSSDDAIIGKTLEGVITTWNRGAERLFGYTPAEVVGKSILVIVPPDRADEEAGILRRIRRGERVEHFETVRRTKDGRDLDISVTSSPVRDASGTVIGASKIARDITEQKRAQRALAQAKEEADLANRELEAFSYSVAHDLRAPLRSIDGFSQALLEDYGDKLDAEGQSHLRRVREAAQRMGQLIDDLLNLSRVTRSEVHRESVDLAALVRATAAHLASEAPDKRVELTGVEDPVIVDADPRLLALVVENLVGNAFKFTGKRTVAHIDFSVGTANGQPVYSIRDNGAGFDMSYAAKLFGVFQRLHSPADFEGTGVGLATVQRIIHRHGGRIWAEGKVDGGATFSFTIGRQA